MPLSVTEFQSTPNPNAIKCVLDHRLPDTPRSYFNAQQAHGDPLAFALFQITGVTNLLIHEAFITVGKRPDADWKALKPAIEKVLKHADETSPVRDQPPSGERSTG